MAGVTEVEQIIAREIAESGAISFARFMELALYHPSHGYYVRHLKQTGREGDFYTSVSVGSLYGELLAFDFAARLQQLGASEVSLIEAGAHDGQLARDILSYLAEYQKETFRRVTYTIIEPSPYRAQKQFHTLSQFDGKVRWVRDWSEIGEFRGICFSNELLDAMPVHVFRWNAAAQDWEEWGVASTDGPITGAFQWHALPPDRQNANARRLLARLPAELVQVFPDQFTVEISPESVTWWMQAAHALTEGWLQTVDYGFLQDEILLPHRAQGTLRGYSRHRATRGVLDAAGEQDITAHVNFSLLIAAAESAGLKTEQFIRQEVFLKGILEQIERDPRKFPLWTPMRFRQLTSLLHPEHLGRAFRVLVQGRPVQ